MLVKGIRLSIGLSFLAVAVPLYLCGAVIETIGSLFDPRKYN